MKEHMTAQPQIKRQTVRQTSNQPTSQPASQTNPNEGRREEKDTLTELGEDGLAAGPVDEDGQQHNPRSEEEDLVAGGCLLWVVFEFGVCVGVCEMDCVCLLDASSSSISTRHDTTRHDTTNLCISPLGIASS